MKKTIFAILPMLLFSLVAFAQLEKGTVLLGGGIGFNSTSEKTGIENKYQSFNVSPDIGYFIQDNWVIGVSLPLSWQDSRSNANSTASHQLKTSSLGVGPFVRKYFPLVDKVSAFGQLSLGYGRQTTELTSGSSSSSSKANTFTANTNLGLSYFPKTWMAVNLSVSPLSYTKTSHSNSEYSNFGFNLSTSALSLGANFFLSKK